MTNYLGQTMKLLIVYNILHINNQYVQYLLL